METNIIYGKNPILEALKSNSTLNKVILADSLRKDTRTDQIITLLREKNIPFSWNPPRNLDKLAPGVAHQGMIAYRSDYVYCKLDDILTLAEKKQQPPFIVILDGIEDPHNLGAIIRTAETAGVHGIIIPKHRASMVNETVAKTSAGAIEHVLIHRATNLSNTIDALKQQNIWVAGLEGDGPQLAFESNLTGAIALVLGSEGKGISQLVKKHCDFLIRIPMMGQINSLNVSAAAAIIIYETLKQKISKNEC